ncbi:hypothetical protein [Butyrivibrio sp. VCD2006]|uniref:hypothetical protein n=1 Tax=Butyrivibrio sp. VCD2006 TaxID=1280664 RepID=UPI000411444E|nr:hypothetical protein [Butyrivibrio sp. VCD2006]
MRKITAGDVLHVYGSLGRIAYSVRLCIRMDELIDADILARALKKTSKRYPYLCVALKAENEEYFFDENNEPVCLFNTDERITLNSAETNYHVWAVCYKDDFIYLDFYHGICDGTGIYFVLATLLYYYESEKYGPISSEGIRTLDDPIDEKEFLDPMDLLPEIDLSTLPQGISQRKPSFSLLDDAGMTPSSAAIVRDVMIPEKELLKFTSANDASPGTFITVITARAIDKINPVREKPLMGAYIINGRPMLHAPLSHHNCVTTTSMEYTDKLKNMPLDKQCTAYRGRTFLQSDEESVQRLLTFSSSRCKMVAKSPTLEAKKAAYAQMMEGGKKYFSYMVSYVGQWKQKEIGAHIKEFWTHVPDANGFLIEVAAVNGNIFLSMQQNFVEDTYYKAFLAELEANNIPYTEVATMENDIAYFPEIK